MVCNRCKTIVKDELDKLGIPFVAVELGEVIINKKISPGQHTQLYSALQQSGLVLIDDHKTDIIEKLKKAIVELGYYSDEDLRTSYSDYISLCVNENFISLNTLFSEIEGITIEKYIIKHKIELIKELLIYNDFSIAEIALKLHYSNVAQLSWQFKSITGLTPAHFRDLLNNKDKHPNSN